jgi:hypothetical protein
MRDMRKDHEEEEDKERSVSFKSHLKKQLHLNESRGGLVFFLNPPWRQEELVFWQQVI